MNRYAVTFHTHFSAMCTHRALTGAGLKSGLAQVRRALSRSCGACVRFASDDPHLSLMPRDMEKLVLERAEGVYEKVAP